MFTTPFTPRGEHSLRLTRRMEGHTEFHPRGQLRPWGHSLPLGVKLRMGLRCVCKLNRPKRGTTQILSKLKHGFKSGTKWHKKTGLFLQFSKTLPSRNNHPLCKNSPNLVTLLIYLPICHATGGMSSYEVPIPIHEFALGVNLAPLGGCARVNVFILRLPLRANSLYSALSCIQYDVLAI
jgi:hypothetical protein